MKRIIFIMIFLLTMLTAGAQNTVDLNGKVTDASGQPLPGVFVQESGTSNAVSTDENGRYSISVNTEAVMLFSCIGFQEVQEQLYNRSVIDVVMQEDSQLLDEIIVVGYGTQKSKDLTAPIVSVKGDDLSRQISSHLMSSLQGKVAGVQVISSGAPGASPTVRIRGTGSIGDYANPLYIVDGVFVDDIGFLSPG